MQTLNQLFQCQKAIRISLLGLFVASGGIALWLVNLVFGFSYADNEPTAVVGHIVGTMLWGAVVAAAIRWARA